MRTTPVPDLRTIVRLGHPALRTPARPVAPERLTEPDLQQLIDDLFATMKAAHGVALAAPQVGDELQLFVYGMEVPGDPSDPTAGIAARVLVNPMLEPEPGELVYDWEGCLSIPGLRGLVPRHPAVRVRGLDRDGRPLDYRVAGLEARVAQHEYDHLNGVLFLDRMRDLQSLAYEEELAAADAPPEDAAVG
jgi:peptide deformylase